MSGPEEPRYPFVHVAVAADESDLVSSLFFDLGATGVEERDDGTLIRGPVAGGVLLVASFDDHETARAAIEALREHDEKLEPRLEEIVGDAWRDAWKEFFKPFALTPTITVRPPWCEAPSDANRVLELEPGRAFGTGLHATTSLVANILEEGASELSGKEVLDAGTGSGILALVALLCGASKVVAFDVDPDVIEVVKENAARNGLGDRIEAFAGTVDDVAATFPWVVANIEARVLDPIAEKLVGRVGERGRLILSGLLAAERDRMIKRYTSLPRRFKLVSEKAQAAAHNRPTAEGEKSTDDWIALDLRALD